MESNSPEVERAAQEQPDMALEHDMIDSLVLEPEVTDLELQEESEGEEYTSIEETSDVICSGKMKDLTDEITPPSPDVQPVLDIALPSTSSAASTTESHKTKGTSQSLLEKGPMQIQSQDTLAMESRQECAGCKKKITERYLLKALDQFWHEDCLKCSCCDCRLGEVGSTLFTKANLLLCRRDYLRLFGTTGYCSACSKMIPAFEMVMRAKSNVYHLECFACQQCSHRFCVGDRFFLVDNKILCEYDYEERMVFATMPFNYNALSHIKRQTNSLSDDLSSGYGSPSPSSVVKEPGVC